MKDHCLELAGRQADLRVRYNILREYVQAYILKIMQDGGSGRNYVFVGGTALRFLYDLPRFSEDLDFSLAGDGQSAFGELMIKVKRDLTAAGYNAGITYTEGKNVNSAFVKFEDMLFEAGLAPLRSQKFSVKIEIDTMPPTGAVIVNRIVNKFFPLAFQTYDLPSLLAGKMHAVLCRKYTKGRDYYDMAWYFSRYRDLVPNLELLGNALEQTGWAGQEVTAASWRAVLAARIASANWDIVRRDVISFLERPEDLEVLTRDHLLYLVRGEEGIV